MTISVGTARPPSTVASSIRRYTGGGPRRIAESAGLVITHGEGSYLVDDQKRRYLDFATAMGVAGIGHGHPVWTRAIAEQAARSAACILHTPQHAAYLERLARYLPRGLDRVALYSGGTEAVEVGVRLAQSVSGHRHIISFTTGFHGKSTGVRFTGHRYPDERASLGVDWVHDVPYPVCTDRDAVNYASCDQDGEAAVKALESYAAHLDGVAAVIVEPVLGTAGNRPPHRGFLQRLRRSCTEHGWLLIDDESITGFGRLGRNFGCDLFGIDPDILILGKAMGGGFPLSGVAARSELWDKSLFAEMSATSSSYGANPLACAAGLAVLDIVDNDAFRDNLSSVAATLGEGIRALAKESHYVTNSRGVGLMLGFDLIDPGTGELAPPELCRRLFRACLDAGILMVGDVPGVRLNPPLTLSPEEADQALVALHKGLSH